MPCFHRDRLEDDVLEAPLFEPIANEFFRPLISGVARAPTAVTAHLFDPAKNLVFGREEFLMCDGREGLLCARANRKKIAPQKQRQDSMAGNCKDSAAVHDDDSL
jgi:hypothetical protein